MYYRPINSNRAIERLGRAADFSIELKYARKTEGVLRNPQAAARVEQELSRI